MRLDPERFGARGDGAGGDFLGLGVFRIAVVLAGIDDRQVPERRHVHDLVEQPLRRGPVPEETHGDIVRALQFRAQGRSGGDPHRAADDGIRAEIAVALIGDMHRPALAPAIALFLAQQLAEHLLEIRALGHAMAVAAVGRGDAVVIGQGFADPDGDGFLARIHMRQPRHLGRQVQLVRVVLEGADAHHLPVHPQIVFGICLGLGHVVLPRGSGPAPPFILPKILSGGSSVSRHRSERH